MIVGLGADVVHVPDFAEQLNVCGTAFAGVFTARERREAAQRAADHAGPGTIPDPAPHLAARWAAKEAFIKAWSQALYGQAPVLDEVTWHEIEILSDPWKRPAISLHGDVQQAVMASLGQICIHVSLSHDGPSAFATVLLESA